MKTLADIRKAIKPLGFNIRVISASYGAHATYFQSDDKTKSGPGNVLSPTVLTKWKPLFDWRRENQEQLKKLSLESSIYGLVLTTP